MIYKLKALGLALVAVFAMSAFAASAASATEFTAANGNYPVAFSGSNSESEPLAFSGDGFTTECKVAEVSGTLMGKSAEIVLTPTFDECEIGGILSATVTMNGCKYWYHLPASGGLALVSLLCPEGKEVTIDAGTCVIHIPEYNGKPHALVTNVTPRIRARKTVTGISMSYTDGFLCPFSGNTTTATGTLTGGAIDLEGEGEGIDIG